MQKRGFASDNNSGVHPNILKALKIANTGHAIGYGDDQWTQQATDLFKIHFGKETDIYFVLNGTGANILGLKTLSHSFHAIICADTAHIQVDECGAPEKFTGCKLIPITTPNGKLTPELIKPYLHGFEIEHHSQPGIISITQATELGTIYTIKEIKALADLAHLHNMYLHLDGARIANAAVALDLPFRAFTRDAGVDVVSFGGTKNGMLLGEAVLFFNSELSKLTKFYRKQAAQLFSKMRFISAQFTEYFNNNLWKKNACHANKMAQLLAREVSQIKQVQITQKTEANGVFAIIPREIIPLLQQEYFFYVWDENKSEVRWMTSFDTQEEDILKFVNLLKQYLQ